VVEAISRYRSPVGISLDPRGLVGAASGIARFWLRATIRTQEQLLALLGNDADNPAPPVHELTSVPDVREAESLSSKMRGLLDRALDHSTRSSQVELFHHILDQLVADEARIIGRSPTARRRRWSTCTIGHVGASLVERCSKMLR